MLNTRRIGVGPTPLSALGCAVGVAAPYPGRAASIVGVMVGMVFVTGILPVHFRQEEWI